MSQLDGKRTPSRPKTRSHEIGPHRVVEKLPVKADPANRLIGHGVDQPDDRHLAAQASQVLTRQLDVLDLSHL